MSLIAPLLRLFGLCWPHETIYQRDSDGLLWFACTRCKHREPVITRSEAERLKVLPLERSR